MNKIYVIIATYNGEKWIERCLDSVYQSTVEAMPIVIDNGSSDRTVQIIQSQYPKTKLILSEENLGFGKANNIGIIKAADEGAEYVYLLNQDAWVEPDVFETLMNTHKQNKEYAILSPLQLTGDGTQLDRSFKMNSVCDVKCPEFLVDYENHQMRNLYETTFVMAAHWLLYVPYLKDVGLFSPIFPHYGEDSNLCHRFRYWKYKIGIVPHVRAYHDRQYRNRTASQEMYLNYIVFLNQLNNPLQLSIFYQIKGFFLFVRNCFRIRGVNMSYRLKTFKNGISAISKSAHYMKIYKKQITYEYFSEN